MGKESKASYGAVRVESFWSLGNLLWTAGVSVGGVVMAKLASFNEFVAAQGVFGYAVVALLSTLTFTLIFLAIAIARDRWKTRTSNIVSAAALDDDAPLEKIIRAHYHNQTVYIDGKDFFECEFDQVTIEYNGGPYNIEKCKVRGGVGFTTQNEAIARGVGLVTSVLPNQTESVDGTGRRHRKITVPVIPNQTDKDS